MSEISHIYIYIYISVKNNINNSYDVLDLVLLNHISRKNHSLGTTPPRDVNLSCDCALAASFFPRQDSLATFL